MEEALLLVYKLALVDGGQRHVGLEIGDGPLDDSFLKAMVAAVLFLIKSRSIVVRLAIV